MFADLSSTLDQLPWPLIGLAVMVLAFLESAALVGLVVPGETGVLACSAVAAAADAPWPVFVGGVAVAVVAGDVAGFVLGQRWGARIRSSRIGRRIGEDRWRGADALLRRHGGHAVVVGRFLPVAQALMPLLAGAIGMSRRRFLRSSAVGALLWSGLYVNAGFLLGESADDRGASLALVGIAPIVAVIAVTVGGRRLAGRVAPTVETFDRDGSDLTTPERMAA